jgi:short-subunit dehydrogenase
VNLVLVARRRSILEQVAAALEQRFGVETCVIDADLSQPGASQQVTDATSALDVGLLVAAAGFGTTGRFVDADLEREISMLDVNCRAVVSLSHHYARRFAARARGGIVLFSSLVAFQGVPFSAHYAATKAYIQSLAEGLHHELAPLGVDVLASAPGPVNSGFASRADMQMGMALDPVTVARETLGALGRGSTVRPGLLSKFLIGSLSLLPRGLRVRAMAQIMQGMTQHQTAARVS